MPLYWFRAKRVGAQGVVVGGVGDMVSGRKRNFQLSLGDTRVIIQFGLLSFQLSSKILI
jgi:hypothetical protein